MGKIRGVFLAVMILLLMGVGSVYAECTPTIWDLTAGQTTVVGTVEVTNDNDNLYVTYKLDLIHYPNATFGNLHMWAGNDFSLIPGGGYSRPAPGQFCQVNELFCYDATGLTEYTFIIPLEKISIVDISQYCNKFLWVVTHAEVDMDGNPYTGGNETAFGGDEPGPGSAWWFYGFYTICCNPDDPPPPFCLYETAYAKGGYVWTTDKKSNPEKLPSLSLTKNRWGWAINLTSTGTSKYPIYAGAGLNKTANGIMVGTLTVDWNGSLATVTYTMDPDYYLKEIHIYAGDDAPSTIAPGQYGYPTNGYGVENLSSYSCTEIPLTDINGGGVWLVAHAVVSIGLCE